MREKTPSENNEKRQRTILQNNALHLWCEQLAQTLNEAGISQRMLLEGLEVDNSAESVKAVFRELGKAKYFKQSTAQLTTKEMMDIYEEFNRQTSKLGIHVAWPSEDERYYQQLN